MSDQYQPNPLHIVITVPFVIGGAALMPLDWYWFLAGFVLLLIGVGLGFWIVVAGINRSAEDVLSARADWERERVRWLKELIHSNNPDIWIKFGVEPPKPETQSMLAISDTTTQLITFPIGGATLQTFADGVLQGKGIATDDWAPHHMSTTKIKATRKVMLEHKLIKEKVKGTPTHGYELTRAGREEMLKHASLAVQLLFQKGDRDRSSSSNLLAEGA